MPSSALLSRVPPPLHASRNYRAAPTHSEVVEIDDASKQDFYDATHTAGRTMASCSPDFANALGTKFYGYRNADLTPDG